MIRKKSRIKERTYDCDSCYSFLENRGSTFLLASKPNSFQNVVPLNDKLFCPKDAFNRGMVKSSLK